MEKGKKHNGSYYAVRKRGEIRRGIILIVVRDRTNAWFG